MISLFSLSFQDIESQTRQEQIQKADGVILVFSVTDRSSFNHLNKLKKCIIRSAKKDMDKLPAILLGNKADLCHLRTITVSEGAQLAKELGCQYYEVSASDGSVEIVDAFHDLYREIYRAEKRAKVKKVSARLQLRQTIKNFTDRHLYRSRTNTL